MLDRPDAVRDGAEVALPELLLVLHAERAVVGRDHLQVVRAQRLPHVVLVTLGAGAQGRRAHPLRALEPAPLLAGRAELLLERQVQVLRAGLAEHVLALVARGGELLHGLLRADVHDVQRRAGEVRDHDRAMGRLLLHLPGAGDAVEVRVGLALFDQLRRQHVDDRPVLGVHHREQPGLARDLHRLEHLGVIRVEDARIRHEELEARDALVDESGHRGEGVGVDAADDLVEPVVDRAVARGLRVPGGQAVLHALAVPLHREVDDRSSCRPRPPPGCRSRTCRSRPCRRTAAPCACARRSRRGSRTCRSRR